MLNSAVITDRKQLKTEPITGAFRYDPLNEITLNEGLKYEKIFITLELTSSGKTDIISNEAILADVMSKCNILI